ncbi:MAG: DUF2155 domain-containing protein [Alphaproteobacteria bacterium]|nr:DUF2155 domain-containing protein [Alphaproteobacteria bacterium]
MPEKIKLIAAALAALFMLPAGVAAGEPGQAVELQGLDKVTGRTVTFQASIGETVNFGALVITVRACDRTPPTEPPESTVFLDIYEVRDGETQTDLFHGWMFASSPALNALEHPVYDVWVLECMLEGKKAFNAPAFSPPEIRSTQS